MQQTRKSKPESRSGLEISALCLYYTFQRFADCFHYNFSVMRTLLAAETVLLFYVCWRTLSFIHVAFSNKFD